MDNILDNLDLLAAYSNETLIIKKTILPKQKKRTVSLFLVVFTVNLNLVLGNVEF